MNNDNALRYSHLFPSEFPIKHRRKVPFGPSIKLNLEYRKRLRMIQTLDDELNTFILSGKDYLELINDAFSTNIHWSVSIEGNPLTFEEVRRISTALLSGEKITENTNGPYQEIISHLYSHLSRESMSLPWKNEFVKRIHKMLMHETGHPFPAGEFRKEENSIRGNDDFEYFVACPPEHIEEEMASLLQWLNTSPYETVVTATVFFHEFESIHPFQDGNGRLGRVLFHVLLQEMGLKNAKLCKMDKEILGNLDTYYGLLGYTDKSGDYEQLINYITDSMQRAYEDAVKEFQRKDVLKDLDETTRKLVLKSRGSGWFTLTEASDWIKILSEQRVRLKLNQLVDMGVLVKEGKTRATKFHFNDPVSDIRKEVGGLVKMMMDGSLDE